MVVEDMAEVKVIGQLNETFESQGRVYDKDGLSPTLRCFQGGGLQPKIIEDFYASRKPRVYDDVAPTVRAEREGLKVVEEKPVIYDAYNKRKIDGDICGTLTAHGNSSFTHCGTFLKVEKASTDKDKPCEVTEKSARYRIRKLTPRECWRLMAFSDEDFDRAASVVSNTQLYKTAGNSIVVTVLEAIFSQMNIKGVKPWNEVHK